MPFIYCAMHASSAAVAAADHHYVHRRLDNQSINVIHLEGKYCCWFVLQFQVALFLRLLAV